MTDEPSWKDDLEPKQIAFVEEYLIDLNATQAAIRAGYSPPSAKQMGYVNLRKPAIAKAIADYLAERWGVTKARIVEEMAKVAFANAGDYMTWGPDGVTIKSSDELAEEQRAAVSEVSDTITKDGRTKRLKLHDKLAALRDLGKVVGLFTDKHEVSGPGGEPLAPEASNRDLARAVLDIFRSAQIEKGEGD
jgi:phage terminase small subunit